MPEQSLAINEVSSYLYSYDRPLYEQLKADAEIPNEVLGLGEDMGDEPPLDRDLLIAKCKVIAPALESARVTAKVRIDTLHARLEKLRWWRYSSAVAAAVGGAIAAVSAILDGTLVTVLASLTTLTSSIANAAVSNLILGKSGTEDDVVALILDLEETTTYASVSVAYLNAVANGDYPVKESAALVSEANKYFGKLVSALAKSKKYVADLTEESKRFAKATVVTPSGTPPAGVAAQS